MLCSVSGRVSADSWSACLSADLRANLNANLRWNLSVHVSARVWSAPIWPQGTHSIVRRVVHCACQYASIFGHEGHKMHCDGELNAFVGCLAGQLHSSYSSSFVCARLSESPHSNEGDA